MHELILASTSKYRQALLQRLGITFEARAPVCDETAVKSTLGACTPREAAEKLACAKAAGLEGNVLASDQVAALGSRIFDKPGSLAVARQQLQACSGATLTLITAVHLRCGDGTVLQHTDVTELRFRRLDADEIERYLVLDQPFDCAGSFKLEGLGISLFERIATQDYTAIIGLPLIAVSELLRQAGWKIP